MQLDPTLTILVVYNGNKIKPLGTFSTVCTVNSAEVKVKFFVLEDNTIPILGLQDCIKLNLIKRVETIQTDVSGELQKFI